MIARSVRRAPGVLIIVLLAQATAPDPVVSQDRNLTGGPVAVADSLMAAGDAARALEVLEAHLAAAPDDYEARWRAARTAVVLSLLQDWSLEPRNAWLARAVDHAGHARRVRPDGVEGRYWSLAAKGRWALWEGARRTAQLGQETVTEAHELLALAPDHPGAHNALGRVGLQVMTLPGWQRFLARILVRGSLRGFTWETTEHHLRRAVELDGDNVLFLRDLGALLAHRGRVVEARDVLERAVAVPPPGPGEAFFQREASAILSSLGRR